ncbi:MAG: nucleoside triphosphate pyrophosphohydrolase family protein [Methylococcales bacterium]|nr:nucleoside triphosphate pyrophosphohydrolase family protein [Methylococcales bacterium]
MNRHLKLVRELHDAFSFPQAGHGENAHLSDMDIIIRQALLMEEGSNVLKALKAGDMVGILTELIDLSYYALGAIAMQGAEVSDQPVSWRHDGFVLSVMRILSGKINSCTSGSTDSYSAVYHLCVQLAGSFINADFDKAFQAVHYDNLSRLNKSGKVININTGELQKAEPFAAPDLSDCLYE